METILAIVIAVVSLLLLFSFSAVIVNFSSYKYYKRIYNSLPFCTFYINSDQVYSHQWKEKDNGLIWFLDENSFCLDGKHYLSARGTLSVLDPYTYY